VLPILLLLGFVLLFAYHLFLNLFLILFSAFVSHCVNSFSIRYYRFAPCLLPLIFKDNTILGKVYTRPAEVNAENFH